MLIADCAPTLESGHTGASDGGRGDVWRTEAAGTQPRAWHSTSGSLAPALAPPQLILTAGTLPGPCFCCYKCSPISLQRRPGRQPVARRCGEELVTVEAQCPVSTVVSSFITTVRHQPGPGQGLVTQHPASPPPHQGAPTLLTGMGVKYCVETESFYIDIQVWVQL